MLRKRLTPIQAIRKIYIDYYGRSLKEIGECNFEDCTLYLYRISKNSELKGRVTGKKHHFSKKTSLQLRVHSLSHTSNSITSQK